MWSLDVESVAEAVHAMGVLTKNKFRQALRGMNYHVVVGGELDRHEDGEKISSEQLQMQYLDGRSFHILPAIEGSGTEFLIAGAILGAGLLAGAIVAFSMTSVRPEDSFDDDTTGYSFNNLGNVAEQGRPLPLIYGEVYTGSIIASQGVKTEEVVE